MNDIELREAIATKVMGTVVRNSLNAHRPPSQVLFGVPAYESDIAAAWLVVEKMRERGYRLLLGEVIVRKNSPRRFDAEFEHIENCAASVRDADTPALAICLAALSALEPK